MCLKEIERDIAGLAHRASCYRPLQRGAGEGAAGIYTQFEVQRGLPIQLLIKHFTQNGELWQIAPELRAMVKYRQLNLLYDFCGSARSI